MAAPIPDERCHILIEKTYFELWKNAAGYLAGPVTPSTTDGTPLFDVAEEGDASHGPVPRADVALEVDGPDVVDVGPGRFPVDGALVQLRVLSGRRVDGVDVDHRHLLVQHLRPGFDEFSGFPVETCAL